jgi:L,D-transpeptidase ErfK/SrfK
MIFRSKPVFIITICLFCSGCSVHGSFFHENTASNLELIRFDQADILLPEEFRYIEDTIRKANQPGIDGKTEESCKYFQLSHAKTELLEKGLGYLCTRKESPEESRVNGGRAVPLETEKMETFAKVPNTEEISPKDIIWGKEPEKVPQGGESAAVTPDAAAAPSTPEKQAAQSSTSTPAPALNEAPGNRLREIPFNASDKLVGRDTVYVVKRRETIKMVSAKTGVNWRVIAKENSLDPKKTLQPGTALRINTMKIIPKTVDNGIVINIPEKTLYLFRNGKLHRIYPVGLGMTRRKDLSSWETPTGKFTIISKVRDPNWYVPYSIQQKLKREGKDFLTIVPPGPDNPLGKYAISTTFDGILIHGTTYPESVNSFRSHGCVRLLPNDMEKFFNTIRVNTSGEIIYKPVKVAVLDNGRVFIEVHADAYNRFRNLEGEAKKILEEKKAMDRVDWDKVKALLKNGNGLVEEITNSM